MGELGALFNPGMRHELEERQAKASRREEEGNARDGDLRIDLESGVAVINVVGEEAGESGTETSQAAESNSASATGGPTSTEQATSDQLDGDGPSDEQVTDDAAVDAAADAAGAAAAAGRPAAPAVKPRGKRGLSHSAR